MDTSALLAELEMLRVNMSIATNRVTELESEKEQFEEIRLQQLDEIKRLTEELDYMKEHEAKLMMEHEEALNELQRQLAEEKQKRFSDFNLYEKKIADIEVRQS